MSNCFRMSLFRRKQGSKDEPEERRAARPDQSADARRPAPELENARPDEQRSPGAIVVPVAGEIVSGLVEVSIVLDEAVSGPAKLEWRSADETTWQRAGSEEQAEEAKGGLLRWETAFLDDGSYLLRLAAALPAGNEVASEPVSVLVDNVGPEIHLREALEGKTLSGFVTIGVEAEDLVSGVSVVDLETLESGGQWRRVAEVRRRPFDLGWNSEALDNGSHRLRIRARDGCGNLSLIGPLQVEIANAPAAAELVDPGEVLRGRVNLIARTPDLRATQMIFELAKAGSSDWSALGTTRAPFHLPVDTGQLADGSYELRIESVSAEGESVYSRRFGPYIVDNTPPAITITKPVQGETLRDRAELVIEVADGASGPALVELSYNDGEEWVTLAALEPEEGKVRGFWQLAQCRPGSCRLRATAFDEAGNETSEEITVTIASSSPSKPEPSHEPEPIPPSQPPDEELPVRQPSAPAADRFGQVPGWDWKRHRSSGTEHGRRAPSGPAEEAKTPRPSAEPASPGDAEAKAEPIEPVAVKQAKKSAAWTWKPSPPRPNPATSERPEPEEEPTTPPTAKEQPLPEPEPEVKSERRAEEEPELETEPALASEEQVELSAEKPPPAVHLVDSGPGEAAAEIEQEKESESPQSAAEEGGHVVSVDFARAARGWDIWELSALVEATPGQDPAREEERRQILYHLREHAAVDGRIPPGFENLIYEVFGELMPGEEGA